MQGNPFGPLGELIGTDAAAPLDATDALVVVNRLRQQATEDLQTQLRIHAQEVGTPTPWQWWQSHGSASATCTWLHCWHPYAGAVEAGSQPSPVHCCWCGLESSTAATVRQAYGPYVGDR